ncbi:unnamed protein product, partial [marine sediment metagenome]
YAFCNGFGILTGDEDTDAQDDAHGEPKNGKTWDEKKNKPAKGELKKAALDFIHTAQTRKQLTQRNENEIKRLMTDLSKSDVA